jgi:hypothetical protein
MTKLRLSSGRWSWRTYICHFDAVSESRSTQKLVTYPFLNTDDTLLEWVEDGYNHHSALTGHFIQSRIQESKNDKSFLFLLRNRPFARIDAHEWSTHNSHSHSGRSIQYNQAVGMSHFDSQKSRSKRSKVRYMKMARTSPNCSWVCSLVDPRSATEGSITAPLKLIRWVTLLKITPWMW